MKKILFLLFICLFAAEGSVFSGIIRYDGLVLTDIPDFESSDIYGYNFARVNVANNSKAARKVKLFFTSYEKTWEVSKTVTVLPGDIQEVVLYFPGTNQTNRAISVEVDDKEVEYKHGRLDLRKSRGYSYNNNKYVLLDSAVPIKYMEDVATPKGSKHSSSSPSSRRRGTFGDIDITQFTGSNYQLYKNWLAYSQFQSVIFTQNTFEKLGAEVKNAIFDYVRTGGVLTIIGNDIKLPDDFYYLPKERDEKAGLKAAEGVFGRVFIAEERKQLQGDAEDNPATNDSITYEAYSKIMEFNIVKNLTNSSLSFTPEETLAFDTIELAGLSILFAIFLGPVNILWLKRKKRMILIFLTVPVISFFLCFSLASYYYVFESSVLNIKRNTLIYLNEKNNKAVTLADYCVFSAASNSEGMRFSDSTSVLPMDTNRRRNGIHNNIGSIILDSGQHFANGWIRARTLRNLKLSSVESVRERIQVTYENNSCKVMNGLGEDIEEIYLLSKANELFRGNSIPAGKTGVLTKDKSPTKRSRQMTLSEIIIKNDWNWFQTFVHEEKNRNLLIRPGQYVAVLSSSPFLKQKFEKRARMTENVYLIGTMNEEGAL